ncbi:ankyrin repeat-containing domain protein [Aspergillus karnatakaensis]|uniref:ankyrin repeat protein n=1 Tax=Aspergillus karnatakaensis TaxID=1810916 RepID=UPI003CCDDBA3
MEPISAFGLISGAFQVGQVITETLAGLASLRGKYMNADLTIETLEQQLTTIKAAITHLEDWTSARLRDSPAEYNRSLDVALDGCRTVMEALSEEVIVLTQGTSSSDNGIEDVMKGHQDRLHSQVIALQLLVQACQCRSSTDQIELLRKAESRHIIWKVADDAATLRSSNRYATSRADTASRLSQRASTTGDTVFDFDRTLAASQPYQRVPQKPYPSRLEPRSIISRGDQSHMTDEGYASGVAINASVSRTGSLVLPRHPSGTISPTMGHSSSPALSPTSRTPSSNHSRRSKSDSTIAPQLDQKFGSKRGKIQYMFRRLSQASTRSGSSSNGPLRGKTSIDLKSPEGASAPLIVKTAQIGSCNLEAKHLQTRRTALLVAAHCGNEAVVNLLNRKNARLDAVDKSGSTALHLAASRGHCGIIELLLLMRSALWVAVERGEIEAVQVLLSYKMTALHLASKQGDDEIVKLLDGAMMTALHYACEKGHIKVIEILTDNKINVDVPGSDRRTPLICAAAAGQVPATELLLKRKASSRCADDAGMTALHWAAYNGHTEIVEILSNRKSSLTTVNIAGRTALHLAAMNSHFAVAELLLRKQLPVEARCLSGLSALHYACLANSTEIARLLLLSSANIEAQIEDEIRRRPVHIVAAQGSMGLLNLLCYRALGVACLAGHAAAVQNLLDRGSPVHLPPDTWAREDSPLLLLAHGWRPYQYAAYHGRPHALEVLLARTLAMSSADNSSPTFQLETIGFAPAADVSEEHKREPESFACNTAPLRRSFTPGTHQVNNPDGNTTPGPVSGYYYPPVTSVSNTVKASPPAQELPGTLEQGLPESRSQTPERMHRPPNSEEQRLVLPVLGGLSHSQSEHNDRESPSPAVWEPQQPTPQPRPQLSHPTPVRERSIQPIDALLRNGDLYGGRLVDTPVSIVEGSANGSLRGGPPSRHSEVETRTSSPSRARRRLSLTLGSDSESIASFSTASEGWVGFAGREMAELPG